MMSCRSGMSFRNRVQGLRSAMSLDVRIQTLCRSPSSHDRAHKINMAKCFTAMICGVFHMFESFYFRISVELSVLCCQLREVRS